jgi:hypothetical protein
MRFQWKRMAMAFAALVLLAAAPMAASAAPATTQTYDPIYASERASRLLTELKAESAALQPEVDNLGSVARNNRSSWQTHANYLERVKLHINAIGDRTAELQRIQSSALPWQQQAISEVTSHAARVAGSTQAAILFLNDNHSALFHPDYREHMTNLAESADNMHETVSKFLEYEKAQQKFNHLQNQLELSRD